MSGAGAGRPLSEGGSAHLCHRTHTHLLTRNSHPTFQVLDLLHANLQLLFELSLVLLQLLNQLFKVLKAEGSSAIRTHLGVCHGEGNGTPLQYSCLENPTDGGAW